MPTIVEGNLTFNFPIAWQAQKVDDWNFYRKKFIKISDGVKSVDIAAISDQGCVWLVEIKDYRTHKRTKTISIQDEFCLKIKDTLAMLASARLAASGNEKTFAGNFFSGHSIYAVLHIEQKNGNKLFPQPYNPANLLQAIKKRLKSLFSNILVLDIQSSSVKVQWSVC